MYSEIVKEYFENPINLGIIKDADAIGIIENESCSDIIKIYIKVDKNNIIKDAKFEAKGCPPVIAACCAITELIKGMNVYETKYITANEIIKQLNGIPKEKEHCAELVEKTLKQTISNFTGNRNC